MIVAAKDNLTHALLVMQWHQHSVGERLCFPVAFSLVYFRFGTQCDLLGTCVFQVTQNVCLSGNKVYSM